MSAHQSAAGPSLDKELSEVATFLRLFAEELKLGNCPEHAYTGALGNYAGDLKPLLNQGARQLVVGAIPLNQVLHDLANALQSRNSRYLLQLTSRFLNKDSREAGRTLLAMVTTVEDNSSLITKRRQVLRAKNLKTKILSLATALVMGYAAAMTPLFAMLFLLRQQKLGELVPSLSLNPLTFWPAIVSFFCISILTSYQLTDFTAGESSWSMLFMSAMLFIITYLLTRQLLTILIW
jgi:hypothetical protein